MLRVETDRETETEDDGVKGVDTNGEIWERLWRSS